MDQEFALSHLSPWQAPEISVPAVEHRLPGRFQGCDNPRFVPEIELHPDTGQAGAPTGVEFRAGLAQSDNPNALATPPVKSLRLTLPPGMAISPAAAAGLASCSEEQIGLGTARRPSCPDASRVGSVSLSTPLLPKPAQGYLYVAAPKANPFGSTFALYLVVEDIEDRGILIKVPGRVDLDPASGRVEIGFDRLPQIPFSELSVDLRGGPRALLTSPPECGAKTVEGDFTSYAQPGITVKAIDSFALREGPEGEPCSSIERRFAPTLRAGTVNPLAGGSSPFVLKLGRSGSDQELSSFRVSLPAGLTAAVASVPLCADPPACSESSRIGTTTVKAGPGSDPLSLRGSVFLAGPYRSAPFSLVAVVPALAGPFDLGEVVVRAALHFDPDTASVRVESDPLPTIVSGIPLALRSLTVNLDRPGFVLNPTSCDPAAITGSAISTAGAAARLEERFQVGSCDRLGFQPRMSVSLLGSPRRGGHPGLRTILRTRRGDANLRSVAVTLPPTELLESRRLGTVCAAEDLAARRCPARSIHGHAKVWSPLLNGPLQGPLFLLSSDNRLPDLVAALNGEVRLTLRAEIDSIRGRLRTNFTGLPDAALSRVAITVYGGKRGLLTNTGGLCAARPRVGAAFLSHDARRVQARPLVRHDCP